uniref:Unannotated protein n=1 Tax=freshwater metagenome TaxID=449393 RepID=A0A6J7N2I9_9ZZZZ
MHVGPVVHQRWVAARNVAVPLGLDHLGEVADRPVVEVVAVEVAGNPGDLGAYCRAKSGLQGDEVLVPGDHAPVGVLDREGDAQVRWKSMGVEVGCTNGLAAALGEFACQCSGERQGPAVARSVTQRLYRLADVLGCGDQLPAQCLREGLEVRRHEVLPQAGNHPAERLGLDLVEHKEREAHRHPAVLVRWVEVVVERQRGLVVGPLGGKLLERVGLSLQQLLARQVE